MKRCAFYLKRFKSKAKIAGMTTKDFELIRTKTKGRLTYPRFNQLKILARDSIGLDDKIYAILIQTVISSIKYFTDTLEILDQEIVNLFSQIDSKLLTISGLCIITAATIYAEVGDFKNFSSPAKLIAFAGFDVKIIQSGTQEHYGEFVMHGSPLLRSAIWNYALPAVRFIPTMNDYYHKKRDQGKHHKVALAHVCRKIIRMMYYIEFNNISYDPNLNR